MKLTEKQKRFADYYIETGNATEAAIKAGYSKSTARIIASENLTKPYIRDYIDEILASKDKTRVASQDEVLQYFTSLMRGELEEEVIVNGEQGVQRLTKGTDIKDRTQGAKELAKRYGLDKAVKDMEDNKFEIEMVDADED